MIKPCLIVLLLASSSLAVSGQEEPGAPEPLPQLRAWIFPATEKGTVALTSSVGEGGEKRLAATADAVVVTPTAYQAVESDNLRIDLKSGERVLASTAAPLRRAAYYTLAAWQEGSEWRMKIYRDDAVKGAASARPVRVFNFAGDRKTVLSLQGKETAFPAGAVETLEAAPALSMVTATVLTADGSHPAVSSVEVDFALAPSAYVVIGPDYRGRMRPRVLDGGPAPEPEEEEGQSEEAPAAAGG